MEVLISHTSLAESPASALRMSGFERQDKLALPVGLQPLLAETATLPMTPFLNSSELRTNPITAKSLLT